MDKSLVSVVIPLYNKVNWISQTILSVANQTYKNWECIIVDDGSTDGSFELVTSLTKVLPGNWKVVRQTNSGQSLARNKGLEMSTGEYIALLDADDIWFNDKLEKQVEFLAKNSNVDLLFTSYIIFEESLSKPLRYIQFKNADKMIVRWLQMLGFGGLIESTGMVRARFFEREGLFDLNLSTSSGLDVSIRGMLNSRVAVLPKALVGYRLSDNQWHKRMDELSDNCFELCDRYGNKISSKDKIRELQVSYFHWNLIRTKRKAVLLKELLSSLIRLDIIQLKMLNALVSRNLRSLFLGIIHSRQLRKDVLIALTPPRDV